MDLVLGTTKNKQVLDITDDVNGLIAKTGISEGVCSVCVLHTTCAITTADLDPGTDEDLLEALVKMFPAGEYRHPHDVGHVGDHVMSSLMGPSVSLPVVEGRLRLGTWQRVVLVELSGPRERTVVVSVVKTEKQLER